MASTTAPPPTSPLDHADLRRFLGALRRQLWWREAAAIAALSVLVGVLLGMGGLLWPARPTWFGDATRIAIGPMLVALAVGLTIAALRRPSLLRAARVADRQLQTSSRLATAAEVLSGQLGGRLARAQLADTWNVARGIEPIQAYPATWRLVQVAAGLLVVSGVLLALSLSGTLTPVEVPGLLGTPGAAATPADDAEATAPGLDAVLDAASATPLDPSTNPAAAAQSLAELQAAAAQSEAAEAALQKLGDALRSTSAARDVGEAIRRGDYDDAANKLVVLGRDADQLSRTSKRDLANTMARVAYDSAKLDPPLAVAEESVARALNRQVYSETRTALENLARTVSDTKRGVVSQEALARSLEQLQNPNQKVATAGGNGGDDEEYYPDVPAEEPKQAGLVRGQTSTVQVPGPEGDPRTADRSDAGLNAGGDPLGDLTSRLHVPPVDLSVEAQLANDRGREKSDPAAPTVKISDTNQNGVRTSGVAQPGDPIQDVAERSVETATQRDAVRAFFRSSNEAAGAGTGTP